MTDPAPGDPLEPAQTPPPGPVRPKPPADPGPADPGPADPGPADPSAPPASMVREITELDLRAEIPEEERAAAGAVDYPMVQENEAAAIPLGKRLRDPRTIMSFVVPIGVLLLLFIALPGFELNKLPGLIMNANPWWLLAALGIYYLGFPLRGYRWALLIRGTGYPLRTKDSTEIIFLSWLVNCVVPAKLGDVYRAYLLRVNYLVSLSTTFGTVFIERIFDLIAIVALGLGAAFWSFRSGMSDQVRLIVLIGLVLVAVLIVGVLVVRNFGRELLVKLRMPRRIVELYDLFEEGIFSVDRRTMPIVMVVTVLIWTTEALRLLFVVQALGFEDVQLGISGAFFVALVASLLTAVPLTPAGLGLVEFGIVGILTGLYHVPRTEALAIALVDRAISVLSIIVFGSIAYVLSSKTKGRPQPAPPTSDSATDRSRA
jgi:glycosyltransferase 2 family protein